MSPAWPSIGTVKDIPSERNLRDIRRRGGGLAETVTGYLTRFPQLAKAGTVKVAFGTVTVTFTASTVSAAAKVTHGLATKPTSITLTQQGTELGGLYARSQGLSETAFEAVGFCPFGAVNGTAVFAWIAFG